jgi:hypothetical protein
MRGTETVTHRLSAFSPDQIAEAAQWVQLPFPWDELRKTGFVLDMRRRKGLHFLISVQLSL